MPENKEVNEKIETAEQNQIHESDHGQEVANVLLGNGGDQDSAIHIPDELPVLPLRDMVVFPILVSPIGVSRESSVQLIDEAATAGNRIIGVVAMRDSQIEKPTAKDIYPIGCAVVIRMMAKGQDGIKMIVQGIARIEIQQLIQEEPYLRAKVKVLEDTTKYEGEEAV